MGSDEKELATAMRTSASGLVPPAGLVAGGIARGRRMKLVRRIQMGTSAAAVLAVAGTTLALVSGTNNDDGRQQVAGPANSTSVSPSPPVGGATPSLPTVSVPAGKAVASPQYLLQTLLAKLPDGLAGAAAATGQGATGTELSNMRGDTMYSAGSSVSLVIEDAKGPTLLSVWVELSPRRTDEPSCPAVEGTAAWCSDQTLADGTRVILNKNWVYPAAANTPENIADGKAGPNGRGPKNWSAQVVRPDGVRILVDEVASREEKGAVARETPLLSTDQLQEIATDQGIRIWVPPTENDKAQAHFHKAKVTSPLDDKASAGRELPNQPLDTASPSRIPTTPTSVPGSSGSGGAASGS